ncbi:hypothetical protein AB0K80_21115 [Streptomyces sp. NPDC052682]
MTSTLSIAATEILAKKPQGPSWSPFLAIGMVILFGVIIVVLLIKRKR